MTLTISRKYKNVKCNTIKFSNNNSFYNFKVETVRFKAGHLSSTAAEHVQGLPDKHRKLLPVKETSKR